MNTSKLLAMNDLQVALYARVSSEHQAEAKTIASQLAEWQARLTADGIAWATALAFVDEGCSGATLARPALERLRDVAAAGGLDRLYVHCPDRLARNYAHQVLLLDELTQAGVEVIFLNRPVGQTPEDQLLVQVQGVMAEYERARVSGAQSARQAARCSSGQCRDPRPCALRLPLYLQAGGRRNRTL
jgi:site-specific DNA recombinase